MKSCVLGGFCFQAPVLHEHTFSIDLQGTPGVLPVHPVLRAAAVLRPVPGEGELARGGGCAAEQPHDFVLREVERRH